MNAVREVLLLVTNGVSESATALRGGAGLLGATQIVTIETAESAIDSVRKGPDLVFFELGFPRYNGTRIERAIRAANPAVPLVAVGQPLLGSIAFRLIAAGVTAYLDAPLAPEDVLQCVEQFSAPPDPLVRVARVEVGVRDLKQAQRVLRLSMYDEALLRTRGSRRAAAKLLGVDRRAVQKMAADLADGRPSLKRAKPPDEKDGMPTRAAGAPSPLDSATECAPPSKAM